MASPTDRGLKAMTRALLFLLSGCNSRSCCDSSYVCSAVARSLTRSIDAFVWLRNDRIHFRVFNEKVAPNAPFHVDSIKALTKGSVTNRSMSRWSFQKDDELPLQMSTSNSFQHLAKCLISDHRKQ
ncbi:hypothetical protein AVEN_27908-1 [Araneus ventricosus]|uniref:Secreted protein n=1 Tax=Araneus ventricosus TaxID=182803 RepID=A0A4Y2HLU7_ARAVE|nr:hypothetical protein AVEN_27908-1 [Araneus ventricosus]